MATATTTTATDPAALQQRIELLDAFDAGDYETVVSKWPPNDDPLLPRNLLWHALVETQRYDQAAATTLQEQEKTLYLDYKRGQYMSILKSYKSDNKSTTNSIFGQVLYAQSLYHLGQYETAAAAFFDVARHCCSNTNDDHDQNDDIAMKAWTNGISCWSADAAKTSLNAADEDIVAEIMTFINDHENNAPYELQYTLATFMLLVKPAAQWRNLLQQAQAACEAENDDDDDDDDDLDLIETNLSYVFGTKKWHGDNDDDPQKRLVRLANTDPLAVSTPLPKEWTPRQRLTLVYNRALTKRLLKKPQDITKECQELKATATKNMKNTNYFWHIRALLLENDTAAIADFIQKHGETDSQSTLLAIFHLAQLQDDPWTYLRTHLPPSVVATPAMQQYAILHSSKTSSDPTTTSTNNNLVEQYEANKNVDEASFARWIRALSMTDPDRALSEWRMHTNNTTATQDGEILDPVELEARRGGERRPRSLASPALNRAPVASTTTSTSKNKKSHEAVLRYRAKKRAEYLARKNIPSHKTPSANRWTSQKQTAAQGAVSSNSAKYDVANRQVTANSTAHLGVKGGGGVGGGKKSGAGGKRR
jgi:hypothetical protein